MYLEHHAREELRCARCWPCFPLAEHGLLGHSEQRFSVSHLPDRSVLEMWMIILKRVLPLAIVFGGKVLECANVFL